jgi:hypothetical protein
MRDLAWALDPAALAQEALGFTHLDPLAGAGAALARQQTLHLYQGACSLRGRSGEGFF